METATFLANFATIADAPGGMDRLRHVVLDLAITGRLVPQDPDEQPATEALERIRARRGATVKARVKGRSSVPRVPEDWERALDTPANWEWARLDDTGGYVNGLAFKQSDWTDSGYPIIRIQNLTDPNAPFNHADGPFPDDRMVTTGDLLVSWSATLEAFVWDRGDAVVNQHIFKVIPDTTLVDRGFLYHLLRHVIRSLANSEALHGLAMKHINRGPFVSHPVAIPPLAEQRRIVEKVDELMALCDDLEVRQQARHQVTKRLRASALDAVTAAATDGDLASAWQRLCGNWYPLVQSPEAVAQLRHFLVRLATTARLDSKTAPWTKCGFGEQITLQRGFDITKKEQSPGPFPVVSSGGIQSYHSEMKVGGPGVVIGRKGSVGRVHWVPADYWPHDTTLWVKDFHGNHPRFVYFFLSAFPLLDYESSTANPSLNRNRLHPVEIEWPQPAVQGQLVAMIDGWLSSCWTLEEALHHRRAVAEALAASSALSITSQTTA